MLILSLVIVLLGIWWFLALRPPVPMPKVLVFRWAGKEEYVASDQLIEWLAMKQLANEEWPPTRDLLKARKMMREPTTEEELRREVWNRLEWVRRAVKRGREALE